MSLLNVSAKKFTGLGRNSFISERKLQKRQFFERDRLKNTSIANSPYGILSNASLKRVALHLKSSAKYFKKTPENYRFNKKV